jgi:hypothetical protein
MGWQTSVEDVVPLVPNEIVEEEQVEAGEDVGETFKGDADQIEMDLERTILMIEDQENVVPMLHCRSKRMQMRMLNLMHIFMEMT